MFTEYDAESARILAGRKQEYRRLYCAYADLGFAQSCAADAVRVLNRLLDQHPDLLAHEERASMREWE